jgi:hypothetical protein
MRKFVVEDSVMYKNLSTNPRAESGVIEKVYFGVKLNDT